MMRPFLAAYYARQARIRRRAIKNAQEDIRSAHQRIATWDQEAVQLEAAVDAALDDGVDLMKEMNA